MVDLYRKQRRAKREREEWRQAVEDVFSLREAMRQTSLRWQEEIVKVLSVKKEGETK